ncbi:MAG TPA: VWA domain-containing protein [Thermoanaerobaculia bacterium]|nr:VWA domain-containing protein [Thermoanaerobaculia bacterium]HUM29251.1 VWA domain-containing protein [Thermoanaerobaculia bacterium]HXK67791.1 VWA domain-containing protein [Thermoanaerobaculia bacterium]
MKSKYAAILILLAFLVMPVFSQEEDTSQGVPVFGETIEVHLVPIQVLVRDGKGNPVTDLKREDFILEEDGKEQEITHFAEVRHRQSVNVFTAGEKKQPPAEIAKEPETTPSTEALLGERYIFYVDNVNIHPLQRNAVLKKAQEFAKERIGNGVLGMVVTFDRSLHIQTPFTDDASMIVNKLEEQKERTGDALVRLNDRRDLIDSIKNREDRTYSYALSKVRGFAAQIHNDMQFTLSALKDYLTSIRGMEGRKVLIYISSGLPEVPAYEVFYYLGEIYPHENVFSYADFFNLRSHYKSIINTANSAGVNLCMVDVSGLRAMGTEGAAEERYSGTDIDYTVETNNLIDPLRAMSEETGGVAIVNTNDFAMGFKKIAETVDNYYFLGYQRTRPIEDKFHKIEVSLKPKIRGARISYKKTFLEKSIHSIMGDKIIANLIFPEDHNPLEISVTFQQPTVKEDNKEAFILPMTVEIPFSSLNLTLKNDRHIGRIKIGIAAGDGKDRSEVIWKNHDFNIPATAMKELEGTTFKYNLELMIGGGANIISVGVLNELDGTESYKRERVFIRPPQ